MTRDSGRTSITDGGVKDKNSISDGDGSGTSTSSFVARVLLNINAIDANRDTLNEAIKQAQNRSGYRIEKTI